MKGSISYPAACAALLGASPVGAQTLLHRYSMNGDARDSVGTASGQVVGGVTFTTAPGVNGVATFPGGNSSGSPKPASYVRLPATVVSGLQNATVEIFTTKFSGGAPYLGDSNGYYQALFDVSNAYLDGKFQTNFVILTVNRDPLNRAGSGLGIDARVSNGPDTTLATGFPLPTKGGLVTLVFSGFTRAGGMGVETIYLDGALVARCGTVFSFAAVASAKGGDGPVGIDTVGIGGGSPFKDPTFNGDVTEVRIWSDALSPAQVQADYAAGPGVLGVASAAPVHAP